MSYPFLWSVNANQKYSQEERDNHEIPDSCSHLLRTPALCALCRVTSPTEAGIQPVGTTVTTPVETTQTATPAPTFEPITTLPVSQAIDFTVNKDRPTGNITLQWTTGPGMSPAQGIDLTVTRADGTPEDQQITNNNALGEINGYTRSPCRARSMAWIMSKSISPWAARSTWS